MRLLASRRRKQALMPVAAGWICPLAGFFLPLGMVLGLGRAAFPAAAGETGPAPGAPLRTSGRPPQPSGRAPLWLAVLAFLMAMLTWQLPERRPDPYAIGTLAHCREKPPPLPLTPERCTTCQLCTRGCPMQLQS